jgi:transketolase
MNKIPNRKAICDVLLAHAQTDRDIVVLCSDSRGSASMAPFFDAFPEQSVEVGIAEQNLVSISAGMAKCGKKAFCFSPASFLSTRSYEQAKVDVAYSNTNVTLVGISGGISYGELGMSHHSAQDIAAMSAIPNMRVYLPSEALLLDQKPAYIRVGRNPVEDIYTEDCPFRMDHATVITDGDAAHAVESSSFDWETADGNEVLLVACGEMVRPAVEAAKQLAQEGIRSIVLDMYCVKPLDRDAVCEAAKRSKLVVTVEEHAPFGGLGSMVSQVTAAECQTKTINLTLPDAPVITGKSQAVFDYYGLNAKGIVEKTIQGLV